MKPTAILVGLGAVVALLIGGIVFVATTNSDNDASPAQTAQSADITDTANSKPTPQVQDEDSGEISSREAAEIAVRHVGGGKVTEIEREFEHGRAEWKVEVVHKRQEIDVRVDAATGEVTREDRDDDRDDRDDRDDD